MLLSKRSACILEVIIFFCTSWVSSFAPEDVLLPWQCLPKTLTIFANLACSRNGTTYIVSEPNQPIGLPTSHSYTEASTTTSFSPWSYKPVCTAVIPSIGSKLCVYTSTEFGRGRGISIFTTPQVAQVVMTPLLFRDRTAIDDISNRGSLQYTQRISNMGRSTLTSYDLKRGDLVSSAIPVVIIYDEYDISHEEREEFLRIAVSQLPIASQRLLSNLTTNFGGPSLILSGIMESNAGFSMHLGEQEHYALVPEISFLNHHCAPNSQFHVDASQLTISVYATRAISRDEEVTISYFDSSVHLQPFANRQQTIRDLTRFNCACSRCLVGKSSDTILEDITILQQTLNHQDPGAVATTTTTEAALKLIGLYEQAGLEAFIYIAYGHAALAYNAVGDPFRAEKYARLASEALVLGEGFEKIDPSMWQHLIQGQ